jgi:CheY-like chemotaxis protein
MSKRVLVIDDEREIRELISACLRDEGFSVEEAEGAMVGLDMCERLVFDVIVTDIAMPDRDGTSLIIELRRRFPSVKIMAVSGAGCTEFVNRLALAAKAGAHMVLKKPFDIPQLVNGVRRLAGVSSSVPPRAS